MIRRLEVNNHLATSDERDLENKELKRLDVKCSQPPKL
jgi:hypothetical protein